MARAPDAPIRGSLYLPRALPLSSDWSPKAVLIRKAVEAREARPSMPSSCKPPRLLEGLANIAFITKAGGMTLGSAQAEAIRRPETLFHDGQDMGFLH
jgi:hypothetical protein